MAEPAKPAKRRVKNPETFRERALKAAEDGDQLKGGLQRGRRAASSAGRPLSGAARTLASRQPIKAVLLPLRLLGRLLFPAYLRTSWRELRQVEWPSRRQSRQLTFAVLVFAAIFGAAIAAVDYGLDKLFRDILLK